MTSSPPPPPDSLEALRGILERLNSWQIQAPEADAHALAAVRRAATGDPRFASWLHDLPYVRNGIRAPVIEALAVDPEAHGQLLRDELERALRVAETARDPRDILLPFWELAEVPEGPGRRPLLECIAGALRSSNPWIRRWAVELLDDLYDPADPWLRDELEDRLDHDPDWRVRHRAYLALRDRGHLPPNHRRSLLDRWRGRWLRSGLV